MKVCQFVSNDRFFIEVDRLSGKVDRFFKEVEKLRGKVDRLLKRGTYLVTTQVHISGYCIRFYVVRHPYSENAFHKNTPTVPLRQ